MTDSVLKADLESAWSDVGGVQLDFWAPESDWQAPGIPDWNLKDKIISVDIETRDSGIAAQWGAGWPIGWGHICGISLSIMEDFEEKSVYLPFNHVEGNGEYTPEKVIQWLKHQFSICRYVVGHNLSYDLGWLNQAGIPLPNHIFDTQVASALLNENRASHSLDNVSREYNLEGKDTELLNNAARYYKLGNNKNEIMGNLWRLPAKFVGPYAEADSLQALKLHEKMEDELRKESMIELFTVEMKMVKLSIEMRKRGIRVDIPAAEKLNRDWIQKQEELEKEIKKITGFPVKPSDAKDLKKVCTFLNIFEIPTTEKKKEPSFKNDWLSSMEEKALDLCVMWRQIQHSRNNYIEGIVLGMSRNGRVYPEMNTVKKDLGGTVSGRISLNNPPLQQISARNELVGPAVRSCFLPEEGQKWGAFDYSQQEPRLSVHFASLTEIPGAEEAVKYYKEDPRADFHQMMSDLSGQPRYIAKDLFLGIVYGMGNESLAKALNITKEEAYSIRQTFNKKVPWVEGLSLKCVQRAGSAGKIRTILNRHCRFNLWEPQGIGIGRRPLLWEEAQKKWKNQNLRRAFTYKALNRLIQASAADQTKQSMVDLYDQGIIPMLQMHDELDFSLADTKGYKRHVIEETMLHSVELQVPSKIDVAFGINWGAAK